MLTTSTEITDRMLIVNEAHLRRVLAGYARHYNTWQPHRSLKLQPPRSQRLIPNPDHERITHRPILGGLINEYGHAP